MAETISMTGGEFLKQRLGEEAQKQLNFVKVMQSKRETSNKKDELEISCLDINNTKLTYICQMFVNCICINPIFEREMQKSGIREEYFYLKGLKYLLMYIDSGETVKSVFSCSTLSKIILLV